MLATLLELQRQVAAQRDEEELPTMALAATALAQELLALCETQRQCAGTYWRGEKVVRPHLVESPQFISQGYVGPLRESGEQTALCNACGAMQHRDRKKRMKSE